MDFVAALIFPERTREAMLETLIRKLHGKHVRNLLMPLLTGIVDK